MKLIKYANILAKLLLPVIGLQACARRLHVAETPARTVATAPDYSQLSNWAAHPLKQDPSDSVPQPLREEFTKDTTVDVFFVHPTSYTRDETSGWNGNLADEELNAKTDRTSILYQASVFNRYNVYAPRYRQAHLQSYYTSDTVQAMKAFDTAYSDIRAAFEYYLENENRGRPIIIASHSQGTTHSKRLMKEFFEDGPLRQQLVAAYLVGINVEPGYFSKLQPCRDSLQAGCFVSWRTFRKGYEPPYAAPSRKAIVVNPLSWSTDTSYVPVRYHKGAVLRNFNELVPAVNDAVIYKDLLWISRPKFPGSRFYRARNYHIGDINLFYINIRENLDQRVHSFRAGARSRAGQAR